MGMYSYLKFVPVFEEVPSLSGDGNKKPLAGEAKTPNVRFRGLLCS